MLLDNEYVAIISVDFTKAFDRICHHALSIKYLQLDLPDHIHNWLMDYFKGRGHLTTAGDQWCSGGRTRGNAVPPLFSEGERDPSLFCSISGIFSAEINEQRRLQDSQFLQLLTY